MDTDTLIMIAALPFYSLCAYAAWWIAAYGMHVLRRIDQSATETQMTETVSPASTQQK
jgi:hypothetical protein